MSLNTSMDELMMLRCSENANDFAITIYDTSILQEQKENISDISNLALHIKSILFYLEESLAMIRSENKTITTALQKHLELLKGVIDEHQCK